jgi:hypothetical protein
MANTYDVGTSLRQTILGGDLFLDLMTKHVCLCLEGPINREDFAGIDLVTLENISGMCCDSAGPLRYVRMLPSPRSQEYKLGYVYDNGCVPISSQLPEFESARGMLPAPHYILGQVVSASQDVTSEQAARLRMTVVDVLLNAAYADKQKGVEPYYTYALAWMTNDGIFQNDMALVCTAEELEIVASAELVRLFRDEPEQLE